MESDCSTSSESPLEDQKYIKELENELKNCSLEIGYLQDQLGMRSIEANCMCEQAHSLELKLAGAGLLQEKLRLLTEKLVQSDEKCLQLTQKIRNKDEIFKNYTMQIEELEASISSSSLDSQCEIESLRLDMVALEERCLQAESLNQQMVEDKVKMQEILKRYEMQLHEAHDTISFLEMKNNELKVKLMDSESKFRGFHCEVEEHLTNWFKDVSLTSNRMDVELRKNRSPRHSSMSAICMCEEVLCPLVSKLTLLTAWDENVKNEMQKMANKAQESELLVEKLKEELKEEKSKAKEEAEDLIQAMAELRYEITGMLEDECKRRASIEQVSIRRIQDLEDQVRMEQRKSLSAIKLLQKAYKLSDTQCNEVQPFEAQCHEIQH